MDRRLASKRVLTTPPFVGPFRRFVGAQSTAQRWHTDPGRYLEWFHFCRVRIIRDWGLEDMTRIQLLKLDSLSRKLIPTISSRLHRKNTIDSEANVQICIDNFTPYHELEKKRWLKTARIFGAISCFEHFGMPWLVKIGTYKQLRPKGHPQLVAYISMSCKYHTIHASHVVTMFKLCAIRETRVVLEFPHTVERLKWSGACR